MIGEKLSRSSYGPYLWILTSLAAVAVLALGLGLGLGHGLKQAPPHHASIPSTKTLAYLSPQMFSNFVVGSIVGQPAQDCNYNFPAALANDALSDARCADAATH